MVTKKIEKPKFIKMKESDLKKVIAELAEENEQIAKIGIILRDKYGIPTTRVYGKKLAEYLKELGIESDIDLKNAEKKVDRIKEHLKTNITDRHTKHKLQKAQSRLNILRKYSARKKK